VVSVRGEDGGPSNVVAREFCVWGSSMRDIMLSCAVRVSWVERWILYIDWGLISS